MSVASSLTAGKQLSVLRFIKEGGIYAILLILLAVIIIKGGIIIFAVAPDSMKYADKK